MYVSSKMCRPRLPPSPPAIQIRRSPGEPNIPSETHMWDRIGTSGAGLFSNPRFRNVPPFGQFFRRQHLEKWPVCELVVLRLFSMHSLILHFNNLHCAAVLHTASKVHKRANGANDLGVVSRFHRRTGFCTPCAVHERCWLLS